MVVRSGRQGWSSLATRVRSADAWAASKNCARTQAMRMRSRASPRERYPAAGVGSRPCHATGPEHQFPGTRTPVLRLGPMNVDLQLIFQNYGGALPDDVHVAHERRIAELAEPLGFDKVFVVEHHFFDYAACPDNAQFLSWLAGRTERIGLATGAFILPWNDPLRV